MRYAVSPVLVGGVVNVKNFNRKKRKVLNLRNIFFATFAVKQFFEHHQLKPKIKR